MSIEIVRGLTQETFLNEFVIPNRPCIVAGVGEKWAALERWTPQFFRDSFGDKQVTVCDHSFNVQKRVPLAAYLDQFEDPSKVDPANPGYARWYTQAWSKFVLHPVDDVWRALATDWTAPTFIPDTNLLFPYCKPPTRLRPERAEFPGSIMLMSSPGCRTKLHTDNMCSDNILIQFKGEKECFLFSPDEKSVLEIPPEKPGEYPRVVDIDNPNTELFPKITHAQLFGSATLRPGDILFIPSNWYHAVTTLTSSISLTFAFIHSACKSKFLNFLEGYVTDAEREQLASSFRGIAGLKPSVSDVRNLISRWPD